MNRLTKSPGARLQKGAFCRAGGLTPPDVRGRDSLLATLDPTTKFARGGERLGAFRAAGALGPRGSTPRLGRPDGRSMPL
jgi:hypothetical protein